MSVWKGKTGTIRLDGDDIEQLREECFRRDGSRCVDCGRRVYLQGGLFQRGHMAHIVGRGAGGSDVLENVQTKCAEHHAHEHNGGRRVVPAKVRA